jgi:hypothetical protein
MCIIEKNELHPIQLSPLTGENPGVSSLPMSLWTGLMYLFCERRKEERGKRKEEREKRKEKRRGSTESELKESLTKERNC